MNKLILLLAFFFSCSNFIEKVEKKIEITNAQSKLCYIKKSIAHHSPSLNLSKFLNKLFQESKDLNFTDQTVINLLLHLKYFPHLVSPYSSIQYIHIKDNIKGVEFSLQNSNTPLIDFAHWLAKSNGKSLKFYQSYIKDHVTYKEPVDTTLHKFILKNKSEILKNLNLSQFYFKGKDPLKVGESLPNLKLENILSQNTEPKEPKQMFLFDHYKFDNIKCNFDSNLYRKGMYPSTKDKLQTNSIIVSSQKQSAYINIHQNLQEPLSQAKIFPYFRPKDTFTRPATCIFNEHSLFTSMQGRDPAQLLYFLIELMPEKFGANDSGYIRSLLNFPRQLILNNPMRILYEGHKGDRHTISQLHKHGLPIYHADSLGMLIYHSQPENFFAVDGRTNNELNCTKL